MTKRKASPWISKEHFLDRKERAFALYCAFISAMGVQTPAVAIERCFELAELFEKVARSEERKVVRSASMEKE